MRALIADKDADSRVILAGYFGKRGLETDAKDSVAGALEALRASPADLLYLDLGLGGMETVLKALAVQPTLPIIVMCPRTETAHAAMCVQRGALDYVTRPLDLFDVAATMDRAVRRRQSPPADGVDRVAIATLEALINTLEARHQYLTGHSARVASLAANIAHELGLAEDTVEKVRMAGRLHDLGKVGVREVVLDKRGTLTPEEYDHIKRHVAIGSDILAPLDPLGEIVSYVRTHHEHWDGSGYPAGLAGEAIPVGGRVLCAAEIFDALTTARPYQDTLSPEEATSRMRQLSGSILDPRIAPALEGAVRRHRQAGHDARTARP